MQDQYGAIPPTLRDLDRWVFWRYETKDDGQQTKVPYQSNNRRASTTSAATWSTFQRSIVARQRFDGIGFVFTDSGLTGIDLDHCLDEHGNIDDWARVLVDTFASYTEISPSGEGLHIFVRGQLPGEGRKVPQPGQRHPKAAIEMYCTGRFFTMTGRHYDGTPTEIREQQDAIAALYQRISAQADARKAKAPRKAKPTSSPTRSDADVLARIASSPDARAFAGYQSGPIDNTADRSALDYHLCCILARATSDREQIARLARATALADREKWERDDYLDRTIAKALADVAAERDQVADLGADGAQPGLPLTDMGNAERLYRRHGADIRYCYTWNSWLVWDGTRWLRDDGDAIMRRAKDTARAIFAEAKDAETKDEQESVVKWAFRSQSAKALASMILLTQDLCKVSVHDLDADLYLWNSPNGTTDLRTGALRAHRREDLITKMTPVPRVPGSTCPRWLANLEYFMGGNQEMIDYLQRWAGYAMTGDVSERSWEIAYGKGNNGKNTFIDTLQKIWGDYARAVSTDLLMVTKYDRSGPEMAQLPGVRLAIASEGEQTQTLSAARVKSMTAGTNAYMTAEAKYEKPFTFPPTHKIFFSTNYIPRIRDTTASTWNRIHLQPWSVTIPASEIDTRYADRLIPEYSGILEWAIVGCQRWLAEGLRPPTAVRDASLAYRADMDLAMKFLDDYCIKDPSATIPSSELYACFKVWCENTGEHAFDARAFHAQMVAAGYEDKRTKRGMVWVGVRVRTTLDESDDDENKQLVYDGVPNSQDFPSARAQDKSLGNGYTILHHPTPTTPERVSPASPASPAPREACAVCDRPGIWALAAGGSSWVCKRCNTAYAAPARAEMAASTAPRSPQSAPHKASHAGS
jgi:putative DNA primase/helicase